MKKLFSVFCAVTMALSATAQQMPSVPVDPNVRIGHLENGLTYYIRHNEEPAGQANFYIAQKVGSILEDENQRGLAHFLEHMCFNGTEKFPGNNVIKYCESIGVQFGADLNAGTSIDQTIYNIDNVPVGNVPSAIDSCLWILHDWADGLLLDPDDIDHERGVIHEEWRTRMNATMRLYEQILPVIYPGNRYGERLPIGTMEVVDNFPYQVLRDYYEKWYRPDLQGIVVVGDIDVDAIEAKIRDIFGTIATPVNPAERIYYKIEDNAEPIICLAKDKEMPVAQVYIFRKHENFTPEQKTDLNYLVYQIATWAITLMADDRLAEIVQSPEPPFMQASVADQDFFIAPTEGAFTGVLACDESHLTDATTALYREMLRIVRGGFTASEYERAKASILSEIESQYNQRDKKKSADYCAEYVSHFVNGEPIPGIETEFALAQQLLPQISVDVINQIAASLVEDGNLVVAAMLPDKEGVAYPTEAEMAAALLAVEAEDIEPYVEEASNEPLLAELPVPGKVVRTKDAKFGYKMYELSNGATVYLKTTDFNADQILMSADSKGGNSQYPIEDANNLKAVNAVMGLGGAGSFSLTALNKALAGKKASINTSVSMFTENVSGTTTPKDFETLLQLNYLYFTALRSDEEAFASWKNRAKASLANAAKDPNRALTDTAYVMFYNHPEIAMEFTVDEIDDIDYGYVMNVARERFADASDFTFTFTGAIDEATALPLIEQYIGSLPGKGVKEKADSKFFGYNSGSDCRVFEKAMEMPAVTSVYMYTGKTKYSLKNEVAFDLALRSLSIILMEEIREKEGGTYGISANGSMGYYPREEAFCQIAYQTDPEKYEYLNGRVEEIVDAFSVYGCAEETLNKGKEYLIKTYNESLRENSFYQEALTQYRYSGADCVEGFEALVKGITNKDMVKAFNMLYKRGGLKKLVMVGVPQAE